MTTGHIPYDDLHRTLGYKDSPIFYRKWLLSGAPGAVVIQHGLSEHSGRYRHVAEAFNKKGLSVFALDARGHGHSAGQRCYVDEYDDYVRDMERFFADVVDKDAAGVPVVLFGHSNGGLISARFALANQKRLKGLALSGPLFRLNKGVPAWKKVVGSMLNTWWPRFKFPNDLEPEQLTHDPLMIEAWMKDTIIAHEVTPRWFKEMEKAAPDALARAGQLTIPLLVQHGGADPLTSPQASREFVDKAGSKLKQHITYDGLRHEIVNEIDRDKVIGDLANWVAQRFN